MLMQVVCHLTLCIHAVWCCVRSARTKLELKLRRTRERVAADLKAMTAEIGMFSTKSEAVLMNTYCDQLTKLQAAMDTIDR